jgi:hypothetical protein
MKAPGLKSFAAGIAAVALLLGLATPGRATLVIVQTGPPVPTGSWDVGFCAFGDPFDRITGTIITGAAFESLGMRASNWVLTTDTATVATISGSATPFLLFTAHFADTPPLPGTTPHFLLNFGVFDVGGKVGETMLEWTGNEFDVIPETSTLLAGVLLLLPLGTSVLRALRRSRSA